MVKRKEWTKSIRAAAQQQAGTARLRRPLSAKALAVSRISSLGLRLCRQLMRSVLVTFGVLLLTVSTGPSAAESDPRAATCLYMVQDRGAQYALSYAGQRCDREGHRALPRDRYDALANWSSGAQEAGIISAFDRYRVLARLATLDERSKHGRHNIHGGFQRWSEYKWAHHTTYAYLTTVDALGNAEVITTSIETPLLRLGLATKATSGIRVELVQRKLSATETADLLSLLAAAEAELAKVDDFRALRPRRGLFAVSPAELTVFRLE